MLEFLTDVSPNAKMAIGATVFLAPILISNEKARGWIKQGITKIGSAWKSVVGPKHDVPDTAPSPAGIQIDTPLAVHQVVTPLMAFFARHQDETGVQLAGAVGQHMYEHSATWMTAPKLHPMQAST